MSKKTYHVVPHSTKWAVRSEGSHNITSVYNTKREAIDAAKGQAGELVVHGPTGQVFQKITVSGALSPEHIRQAVRTVSGRVVTRKPIKKRVPSKKSNSKAKANAN